MKKNRIYKNYYTAEQIAELTENSVSYAYKLIRRLNNELNNRGKLTFNGRVHKDYFHEKFDLPRPNEVAAKV